MCKSVINAINFAGGGGGSVNTGVLQVTGGVALDATLRYIEDQSSNASLLKLSTTNVAIGSGTITQNGLVTIKGDGGNIVSFRNSGNVERLVLTQDGTLTISDGLFCNYIVAASGSVGAKIGGGLRIKNPSDGVMLLQNDAASGFDKILFGGTGATQPAIMVSGGELHCVYADGTTGFSGFAAGEGTKKGVSVVKGASNTPYVGFFNADEIAQPTTAIAEATLVGNGGSTITNTDTIGGYTLQQIVQALLDLGLLG